MPNAKRTLITDASDFRIASYSDVGDPAALARKGLFVAEGRLTVERPLDDRRFAIDSIAATSSAAEALRRPRPRPQLRQILKP